MPELSETLVLPTGQEPILELDELWSFVLKKANKRWIWIALCRQTRQVVAYQIGDRSVRYLPKVMEEDSRRVSAGTLLFGLLGSVSIGRSA